VTATTSKASLHCSCSQFQRSFCYKQNPLTRKYRRTKEETLGSLWPARVSSWLDWRIT
jgi:hypothetical protein